MSVARGANSQFSVKQMRPRSDTSSEACFYRMVLISPEDLSVVA